MRFAIVTPVKNCAKTIDETILSVVSQVGTFHIRYHVQDAGSSDGTLEKVRAWEARIRTGQYPTHCEGVEISLEHSPDAGMYDGLNRGFGRIQGDVMGWINADDRYQPGAFQTVSTVLTAFPEISWLGGRHTYIDGQGSETGRLEARPYAQELLRAGLYEGRTLWFLQQEGVFWRKNLWERCGRSFEQSLRFAGDFELWCRFAQAEEYYSVDATLGAFRVHPGQATACLEAYYAEIDRLCAGEKRSQREDLCRTVFRLKSGMNGDAERRWHGPLVRYDSGSRQWYVTRECCFPRRSGGWLRKLLAKLRVAVLIA